ncbi:hypothetical protein BDZ90DRAFT_3212 [Jaminaea rosea]|uniref:Uncharacterized protein n=1 Tax=Jaminaea rosea TaxID=1569628 RepID=A0A316UXK2_9BASI|nr:hypothetical protein BDZ90DRAFT_3212 [Jaminaea rosea]PWN30039.1 hypothetical protein BDZ90DRAFT_3212 [Jaminaea rosea]
MDGHIADVGSRGSVWIQDRGEGSSTGTRLEPAFGNRRQGNLILPRPASQPLAIFPASRASNYASPSDAKGAQSSTEYLRGKHPEFQDAPDEVLRDLLGEAQQSRTPSTGCKVLITPYLAASNVSLIVNVGGSRNENIYISTLHPPGVTADGSKRRRRRSKTKGQLDNRDQPTLRPILLPAFISDSPIVDISLAPNEPAMPGSRHHEGPWISIRTLTALHFCAIHRVTSRKHDKASRPLPPYTLNSIATILTRQVYAERDKDDVEFSSSPPAATFSLDRYPVSDVAWDPSSRSTALIVDTQGNIWQWSVDLLRSGDNKWLSRGHRLQRVSNSPLPPQPDLAEEDKPARRNHRCRVAWSDAYGSESVILSTDHAVWVVDLRDGDTEGRIESVFEAAPSTTHLRRSRLHALINLSLPHPLSRTMDHSDEAGLPLLIAASSTSLHVLDAVDPRQQLLTIPHNRHFDDDTLTLTFLPGLTHAKGQRGYSAVLLSSTRDSTTTLYGIGCSLALADETAGQRRVTRAWQAHGPCEWAAMKDLAPKEAPVVALWKQLLPVDHQLDSPWRRWRRSSVTRDVLGKWATLQRDATTGEVWLTGWCYRGPKASNSQEGSQVPRDPLPITVYQSQAVHELRALIAAQEGHGVLAARRVGQVEAAHAASWAGSTWSVEDRKDATTVDFATTWARMNAMQDVPTGRGEAQYDAIARMPRALSIVGEVPCGSMVTGQDLMALASLHGSSSTISTGSPCVVGSLTPFWYGPGAISSLSAPHTLLALGKARIQAGINADLIAALTACRALASGLWWDGERWPMATLLRVAEAVEDETRQNGSQDGKQSQSQVTDEQAEQATWQRHVEAIVRRYAASNTDPTALSDMTSSIWQLIHHLVLSNEVWSPRPITIEALPSLPLPSAEEFGTVAQTSTEWDAATVATRGGAGRSSRQDRLPSGARHQSESLRSKMARMGGGPIQRELDSDVEDDFSDDEDAREPTIEEEASRRYPPPEPIHFSYFQPTKRKNSGAAPGSAPTTLASRLLLSTWPLTSLDPTSAENDPSYYTYSDPYVLLDAARRTAEGGYSSADSAGSGWASQGSERSRSRSRSASASASALASGLSDIESGGWTSSVGGAGGWTSGAESAASAWLSDDAARAIVARRSVWAAGLGSIGAHGEGSSAAPLRTSQRGSSSLPPTGTPVASSSAVVPASVDRRAARRLAPPSIVSSSTHTGTATGTGTGEASGDVAHRRRSQAVAGGVGSGATRFLQRAPLGAGSQSQQMSDSQMASSMSPRVGAQSQPAHAGDSSFASQPAHWQAAASSQPLPPTGKRHKKKGRKSGHPEDGGRPAKRRMGGF